MARAEKLSVAQVEAQVEAVVEPVVEAVVEPVVEAVVEPVVEAVVEPVVVESASMPSMLAQVSALSAQTEVKKAKSQKNENVWGNVKMLFDAGKTNKETLAEIHEMYGNTSTTYACIAWYRNKYNKLAKSGKITAGQLLEQIACQFGQDQDWVKAQLSKV